MAEASLRWISPGLCVDKEGMEYGSKVLSTVSAPPPPEPNPDRSSSISDVQRAAQQVDRFFFCSTAELIKSLQPDNNPHPSRGRAHVLVGQTPLETFHSPLYQLFNGDENSFLNIGSESGYVNFVAGHLVGPFGQNHGLESDTAAFEASTTRAKEIHVCFPLLRKRIALPTFYNCHMSEVPHDRQYDRILCSCVSSLSDRQHIANLLQPGGKAILLFEQHEGDDTEQPRFCETILRKCCGTGDDLEVVCSFHSQLGSLSPRLQTKTNYRDISSTLQQQCLLTVDQQIIANIPYVDTPSMTIITDWDAVVSMKFESEVNRVRGLLSDCLEVISRFDCQVDTAESSSKGLVSTMTDLKQSLEQLTERAPSLFPNRQYLPQGVEPSFSFSVCAMDHLHVLPSVMVLIVEELLNKGSEQHCALSDAEWTPADQASWTAELNDEWLSTFHRQALRRMRDDAENGREAYLSQLDFQQYAYFHDLSLSVVFALKRVVSRLTISAVRELLCLLVSNASKLERVTSIGIDVLTEDLKSSVSVLASVDGAVGERIDTVSLEDAELDQSRIMMCVEQLLGKVTCKVELRSLVRLVSDQGIQRQLCEMWWTLQTLEKTLELVRGLRIPTLVDEGSEQPQSVSFCAVNVITDRFELMFTGCGGCSRDTWTGMVLMLSRCIRSHLQSADRVLSHVRHHDRNRLVRYREAVQSEKLKLPQKIKNLLYKCTPRTYKRGYCNCGRRFCI